MFGGGSTLVVVAANPVSERRVQMRRAPHGDESCDGAVGGAKVVQ